MADRKVFVLHWWLDVHGSVTADGGNKVHKVPKSNVNELNALLDNGWRQMDESDSGSEGAEGAAVLVLYRETEVTK